MKKTNAKYYCDICEKELQDQGDNLGKSKGHYCGLHQWVEDYGLCEKCIANVKKVYQKQMERREELSKLLSVGFEDSQLD
jgi:hypothetical protein